MSNPENALAKIPLFERETSSISLPDLVWNSIDYLEEAVEEKTKLKNVWLFDWSTTSENKRYFALRSFSTGIVPLLKPITGLEYMFNVAELNPKTGRVTLNDKFKATHFTVPEWPDFPSWSVEEQAEKQALVKAIGDPYFDFVKKSYILATDCRGYTLSDGRRLNLDKVSNREDQKINLKAIFKTGVIEGAVGVAVGHRKPFQASEYGSDMWSYCWSQIRNFHEASQGIKVYLNPISDEKIDEYIASYYEEICKSGWVLNTLGEWCQKQHAIKRFELEDLEHPGTFREVTFAEAAPVIAGYPVELIQKLLNEHYPNGNYSDNPVELRGQLRDVYFFLIAIWEQLTGRNYFKAKDNAE